MARYGLYRGVFLVCIGWGVYSLQRNLSTMTDFTVVPFILIVLAYSIVLGFALSWITLRSRSILPAAIMHWAMWTIPSNINIWGELACWAAVDMLLFFFWPPRSVGVAGRDGTGDFCTGGNERALPWRKSGHADEEVKI